MPYLGNTPIASFLPTEYQDLTGVTGSPVKRGFTLDYSVANANELEVFVNNVRQEPNVAYTATGTSLTMTGDVEATDDFYVVFQGKVAGNAVPADGSITTSMFAAGLSLGAGYFQGENGVTGDATNGLGDIFRVHEAQLDTDVTIASGNNALCAGPLTVATGVTVTVNGNLVIA
jgi:hypothetical protein